MKPEEFKNIAPKLAELQKIDSGFTVPQSYFETIEDTMLLKITEGKKSGFTVPKDYFETIEKNVIEKLETKTKVINFKTLFIKTFFPIAVAASFVLFFTLQLLNNANKNNDLFARIEISEIENWIENEGSEIDTYQIAAVYDEYEFENIDLNQLYKDANLIDYLDYIDIELLILTN